MLKLRLPYWTFLLAGAGVVYAISGLTPDEEGAAALIKINDPGKMTLDFIQESSKIVSALNTAMLGAAAALVVKGKEWTREWSRLDGFLVTGVFLSGATSYYGGYRLVIELIGMISTGYIAVHSATVSFAMALQYYGLLGGVLCLGVTFSRLLERRGEIVSEPSVRNPFKPHRGS